MVFEDWSFLDALYMTVITLTTVGFREVRPLDATGQVFTIVLLVMGVGLALITVALIAQMVAESQLGVRSRRRRMEREIDRLRDHTIICAYGRVGRAAARELAGQRPFLRRDRPAGRPARADGRGRRALPDRRSVVGGRPEAGGCRPRALAHLRRRLRRHERLHHPDRALDPHGPADRGEGLGARVARAARAGRRRSRGLPVRHQRSAHGQDGDAARAGRRARRGRGTTSVAVEERVVQGGSSLAGRGWPTQAHPCWRSGAARARPWPIRPLDPRATRCSCWSRRAPRRSCCRAIGATRHRARQPGSARRSAAAGRGCAPSEPGTLPRSARPSRAARRAARARW